MKPAVIAKMCGTKIKYPTAKDAARAIEQHRKKYKMTMRSYVCPVCQRWHLSKKEAER